MKTWGQLSLTNPTTAFGLPDQRNQQGICLHFTPTFQFKEWDKKRGNKSEDYDPILETLAGQANEYLKMSGKWTRFSFGHECPDLRNMQCAFVPGSFSEKAEDHERGLYT